MRTSAVQATLEPGVIPDYVRRRLSSVRAYDERDHMRDAAVCAGSDVAAAIDSMFSERATAYVHLHNASRGCFSCRAERA